MIFLLIPCYLIVVALILTFFGINKRHGPGDRKRDKAVAVMGENRANGSPLPFTRRSEGGTRQAVAPAPVTPKAAWTSLLVREGSVVSARS